MSYENYSGGLTELEQAAGVGFSMRVDYSDDDVECSCAKCEECESRSKNKNTELQSSVRFKEAAKLVADLSENREVKYALIKKIHQEGLDLAIVLYMRHEKLPKYYATILKSQNCIDRLMKGIFYKVCKIRPTLKLTEEIIALSSSLRRNHSRCTPYERVSQIQKFVHQNVDKHLGEGAARSIPVEPMKNALSASRLHLSIFDVIDHSPLYIYYMDSVSTAAMQLEYDEPRPSAAPLGKETWKRWRVRHLRPLSYYFSIKRRELLQELKNLDENISPPRFVSEAIYLYVSAL